MSEYYSRQIPVKPITSATLTTNFNSNVFVIDSKGMSKLGLDLRYTRGGGEASSKLQMKIQTSVDRVNWHDLVIDETSTVSTVSPRVWEVLNTSNVNVLVDIAYIHTRVLFAEAGVVTNFGTLSVDYTLSGQ